MRKLIARALTMTLSTALLASTASIAQDPSNTQKPDATALTNAPAIAQMIVDLDGTLHFGPRTVPPPALYSDEARAAYIKMMVQHAQASAARGRQSRAIESDQGELSRRRTVDPGQ